jgi:Fe-S oxidoreductase
MAIVQSILTLLLVAGAFSFMALRLVRVAALVNSGSHAGEVLTGRPWERLSKVVSHVFLHKKVLEDRPAGLLHLCFLYGFATLGLGHLEIVLEGLTAFLSAFGGQPFSYARLPLGPGVLLAYHASQDVLAGTVMLAAAIALARRVSGRVPRLLPRTRDGELILYFILALYVTFFALSGTAIALSGAGDPSVAMGRPLSRAAAAALGLFSPATLVWLHAASWWAHVVVFLGFAVYIPLSKHMHLVFAAPNIYFFREQRMGLPPAIDFEATEKFGIDRATELPWKTLLDSYACTECGRCNSVCPAHLTSKPLKPMKVLHDLKVNLRERNGDGILQFRDRLGRVLSGKADEAAAFEPAVALIAAGEVDRERPGAVRFDGAYAEVDGQVHVDELWACTTCAACVQACPVLIDSVPGTLVGLRQHLVMMESAFPKELTGAFRGMEVQGNPWGVGADAREEWAEGLDVARFSEIAEKDPERVVEYLLWVGCAGATDDRAKRVQRALVKVLRAAGVDFAILGREERCTGDAARRMGNEYLFRTLAEQNIETLGRYRFKKILATCPHCVSSLGRDYRELGAKFELVHHSVLIQQLLGAGRLALGPSAGSTDTVTFHDPCYLGRYSRVYEAPRDVLAGLRSSVVEMDRARERSFCCGAGGGRMWMEETLGGRVNLERTTQALATGAATIAVACPFCMTMLSDGVKAKGAEASAEVRDLAELVAERLAEGPAGPTAGRRAEDSGLSTAPPVGS